jgi:hypothetical protein
MGWNRKEPPHLVHERIAMLNAVLLMCGPGGIEDTTSSCAIFRFVIFALSVFSRNRSFGFERKPEQTPKTENGVAQRWYL